MNEKKTLPPELEPLSDVLMDGDEFREGILALGAKFDAFAAAMKEDEGVVKSGFGTSPAKLSQLRGDKRWIPKVVVEFLLKQTPEPDERGQEGRNQREWKKFLIKLWRKVPAEKRAQVGYVEPPAESPAPTGGDQPGASQAGAQTAAPASAAPVARFPMKALVRKLTLAIERRASRKGFTPGRLARRLSRVMAKRVAERVSRVMAKRPEAIAVRRKLATVLATVNHMDAKVDLLGHRFDRFERRVIRAVWGAALLICGIVVLTRAQAPSDSTAWNAMVNLVKEAAEQVSRMGSSDAYSTLIEVIGGRVGEHKTGRPMPHHPLPHQAKAPCHGSASTLYGGCWERTAYVAPCPADNYQDGDKCYIPLTADPNVPVGTEPRPGPELPTGNEYRPGQDQPAKEP